MDSEEAAPSAFPASGVTASLVGNSASAVASATLASNKITPQALAGRRTAMSTVHDGTEHQFDHHGHCHAAMTVPLAEPVS